MRFGRLRWLALVGSVVLLAGGRGQARTAAAATAGSADQSQMTLAGQINDHTIPTLGSWEIHGVWTLNVKGDSGKADFTAALTMERSDYWLVNSGNPNDPAARNAHTHHVSMNDGLVTMIANGFRVSGPATVTGNGGTPPFGTSSTLQVDVTGADLVAYSNIALTFGGDAASHFGGNRIAGVVSGKHIE
jgi:hypothetical protein